MYINNKEVLVLLTEFQEFDQGKAVEVDAPEGIELNVGDTIWWVSGSFDGICRVVELKSTTPWRVMVIKDF